LSDLIEVSGDIDSGLATDGDADRIGLYNHLGEFVDSHHIILLLIYYLNKHKGLKGKVVTSFSCTSKIKKLCALFGLEQETTKIGFKYICDIMVAEDCLLGGEESGGIAIKGHIPERDGIWIGLVIWEFMAKTGKSLNELIEEVYEMVGSLILLSKDLRSSASSASSCLIASLTRSDIEREVSTDFSLSILCRLGSRYIVALLFNRDMLFSLVRIVVRIIHAIWYVGSGT